MVRLALLAAAAAALVSPEPRTLTVWSAGAVEPGLRVLAEDFRRETGHALDLTFATGPELAARLASPDVADVIVAPAAVIEEGTRSGVLQEGSEATVAQVGVGVTVRRGAAVPDISTVSGLKRALLDADRVVYNTASTGRYVEQLLVRIGVAEQVKGKTKRYGNGPAVFEHIAGGSGREIGFGAITEIRAYEGKGLTLVGPLPRDVQHYTTYVAALTRDARLRAAGLDFIRFLTSPAARHVFAATGIR